LDVRQELVTAKCDVLFSSGSRVPLGRVVYNSYKGYVYFFSARRKLVVLNPNKLEEPAVNIIGNRVFVYIQICQRGIKYVLPYTR